MSLASHYRITHGRRFRIDDIDPGDTRDLPDAGAVAELRSRNQEIMVEQQKRLYASHRWSLLLIFQALDAGGKDSTIGDVLSGINPQGCHVASFKVPTDEELDHDFLWRYLRRLPERGKIGVFNRSYYEDVLVPRVHEKVLDAQRVPSALMGKSMWPERLEDIAAAERYLTRNGVVICKFFLHVSKREQRKRLLARLDDPTKNWKFASGDLAERLVYGDYLRCYQDAIRATAAKHAPWYVIPADHKWFARAVVSEVVVQALQDLKLEYPRIDPRELAEGRKALGAAKSKRGAK